MQAHTPAPALHDENQIEKAGCSRFDGNFAVRPGRSRWLNPACARRSNVMNLPPEVHFHEDIRLLIWRPRGLVNEAAVNKILTVLEELEGKLHEPFNRFSDTLEADEVELTFKYVIHVSLYRRLTYANRPPVKSAILARHSALIHYGRLHAVLTQGSPINVHVFEERKQAARWLEVPIEVLTPGEELQKRMTRI